MAKPYCRRCPFCGEWFEVPAAPHLRHGPKRKRFCSRRCGRRFTARRQYYQLVGKEPPPLDWQRKNTSTKKRKNRYGQPAVKPNPPYTPFVPQIDWSGKGGELVEEE